VARNTAILPAVIIGLLGLGVGLTIGYATSNGDGSMMSGMGSMMGNSGRTGRSGPSAQQGAPTIKVTAREFSFSPKHLRIKANQTVNIDFVDAGSAFHTFTVVGGTTFSLQANAGESISGSLTLKQAGTYQFICAVPGHAQAGMEGTITVT